MTQKNSRVNVDIEKHFKIMWIIDHAVEQHLFHPADVCQSGICTHQSGLEHLPFFFFERKCPFSWGVFCLFFTKWICVLYMGFSTERVPFLSP